MSLYFVSVNDEYTHITSAFPENKDIIGKEYVGDLHDYYERLFHSIAVNDDILAKHNGDNPVIGTFDGRVFTFDTDNKTVYAGDKCIISNTDFIAQFHDAGKHCFIIDDRYIYKVNKNLLVRKINKTGNCVFYHGNIYMYSDDHLYRVGSNMRPKLMGTYSANINGVEKCGEDLVIDTDEGVFCVIVHDGFQGVRSIIEGPNSGETFACNGKFILRDKTLYDINGNIVKEIECEHVSLVRDYVLVDDKKIYRADGMELLYESEEYLIPVLM